MTLDRRGCGDYDERLVAMQMPAHVDVVLCLAGRGYVIIFPLPPNPLCIARLSKRIC